MHVGLSARVSRHTFFCICMSYFKRERERERVDDRLFVLIDFSDL